MSRVRSLLLIFISLLLFPLVSGCSGDRELDIRVNEITDPYVFSIARWEVNTLVDEARKLVHGDDGVAIDGHAAVLEYFDNVHRIWALEPAIGAAQLGGRQGDATTLMDELEQVLKRNEELAPAVEKQLETQIREVLSEQGIYNPLDKYLRAEVGFPPLNFHLGRPPHVLVVSPRDRIDSIREITLEPEMELEDIERIEAEIDSLGVSSLVVDIGGIATYPNYVTDQADLKFVIDTAVEEWLHQYLSFTPLGARYVLDLSGIHRDSSIATMNETVAGIVSKEIGKIVYNRYYGSGEPEEPPPTTEPEPGAFDYYRVMRETRLAVDDFLTRGEVEQAEAYMEQRRRYLFENGYYIRKLNQAYFAFHGSYADSPASVDPIGEDLRKLRSESATLRDFLDTAIVLTSRDELAEIAR